mgnify:CR=1 FL=1
MHSSFTKFNHNINSLTNQGLRLSPKYLPEKDAYLVKKDSQHKDSYNKTQHRQTAKQNVI